MKIRWKRIEYGTPSMHRFTEESITEPEEEFWQAKNKKRLQLTRLVDPANRVNKLRKNTQSRKVRHEFGNICLLEDFTD